MQLSKKLNLLKFESSVLKQAGLIEMGLYVKVKEESRILVCDCLQFLTAVKTIMKDQDESWPNPADPFFYSSVVCVWEERGTFSSSYILCKRYFLILI